MTFPKFYSDTTEIMSEIHNLFQQGVSDRQHPYHLANFSYIEADKPYCRTVVLREYNQDQAILGFHTDIRSKKIAAILKNKNAVMHFYAPDFKIQVSCSGFVVVHHQDQYTKHIWDKTSDMSKKCYFVTHSPSTPISSALFEEDEGYKDKDFISSQQKLDQQGYQNFAAIQLHIQEIEWLYLHHQGNQRCLFQKKQCQSFSSQWLAP